MLSLWCAVPRSKSGYAKDTDLSNIEIGWGIGMRKQLEQKFVEENGPSCQQVHEMEKGEYMVEDRDFPTVCRTFEVRIRVTLDHAVRGYVTDPLHYDRIYGKEGARVAKVYPYSEVLRSEKFSEVCVLFSIRF